MAVSERFQGANVVEAGKLSPYWGEHVARYSFAAAYVVDKAVLDIACGTGYGLAFLKSAAKSVTGVDRDLEALYQAKSECDEKSRILLGDGTNLPFEDESFDVVTSFETLEHLNERGQFLSEIRRILRPAGKLILSTPNANYTTPVNGKPSNPFHVFEYTPEELGWEIKKLFFVERFLGQTLDPSIRITPFHDAQRRLPKDPATQAMLFGWKVFNKIPFVIRERMSGLIWGRPFYPSEMDYNFEANTAETAPTLVAVCRKD